MARRTRAENAARKGLRIMNERKRAKADRLADVERAEVDTSVCQCSLCIQARAATTERK